MESHFHVEVRHQGQRALLTLSGELDVASSAALEEELVRLNGVTSVVLDLRQLEFIDSTGLGVLVKAHHQMREAGEQLTIIEGDGQVRRLLELTGLDHQLTLISGPEDLPA